AGKAARETTGCRGRGIRKSETRPTIRMNGPAAASGFDWSHIARNRVNNPRPLSDGRHLAQPDTDDHRRQPLGYSFQFVLSPRRRLGTPVRAPLSPAGPTESTRGTEKRKPRRAPAEADAMRMRPPTPKAATAPPN